MKGGGKGRGEAKEAYNLSTDKRKKKSRQTGRGQPRAYETAFGKRAEGGSHLSYEGGGEGEKKRDRCYSSSLNCWGVELTSPST